MPTSRAVRLQIQSEFHIVAFKGLVISDGTVSG